MTFIVPEKGESIADMRKKLAAFEARRLGFGPDGAVESRALNPCGQDQKGQFGPGNTCAAKGTSAIVADPPQQAFAIKRTETEPLQTGGSETGAAYRALFEDHSATPGDILRAYGWKGDSKELDDLLPYMVDRTGIDADKKESVAGFLVGIGRAIEDFPDIADVVVRSSTRSVEADAAEARFREQYGDRIASPENPLGVSMQEFDAALAEARAAAEMPAAHYNLQTHEITVIVDNSITSFGARMNFSAGAFSSPSPIHTGYHEAAHAAHAKNVRREAGLPESGPLTTEQAQQLIDVRDHGAFKMATAMILDPGSFAIYRDSPKTAKDSPDAVITRELAARVSLYGVTNTQETVAEYLAGVAAGGIPRDPAVEEVLRYVHSPAPAAPRSTGELTSEYAKERAKAISQGRKSP